MRNLRMFTLAAVLCAFGSVQAIAGYHSAPARDITLTQIEQIAMASTSTMPTVDIDTVNMLVAELRANTGTPTSVDLAKLATIKAIFEQNHVTSVRLDGALVIVAESVNKLSHMYAHVIRDHGGIWQLE